MSYFRTPEHRARQSALIRTWRPWERSTGPQSLEGKATASRNACKGRHRQMLRELSSMVNAEIREARELTERVTR